MIEALQAMGSVVFDPYLVVLILITTILGVVIGVLPGLGATTGAALLLPFTLTMEPVHAITVLATIYVSATFAGSITAILINTPGTSAAAATTFDGYPLAQRGEAGRALGIAVVSSTIGGVFSVIVLCIAAPMLARVAYEFRPPEYFALALFGLSMLASISAGGTVKNLTGGVFGVWLATIGAEPTTGIERFMFGNYELFEGLSFVPVFIGIFAISELLVQSNRLNQIIDTIGMKAVKLPSREDYKKIWKTVLRSCGIGTFIGVLPAEGATVASMIGYAEARRWSKNKEEFGKGAIEGIAGAEAANNAACSGSFVPLLTLGIPGSGTTAVMLGALISAGVQPGPRLLQLLKAQPALIEQTAHVLSASDWLGFWMTGNAAMLAEFQVPVSHVPPVFPNRFYTFSPLYACMGEKLKPPTEAGKPTTGAGPTETKTRSTSSIQRGFYSIRSSQKLSKCVRMFPLGAPSSE